MKNYIGNLYNRKTYLIKILNNLTLAKKIFPKKCRKITFLLNVFIYLRINIKITFFKKTNLLTY